VHAVRQAAFFEHDVNLVAVRRGPRIHFDRRQVLVDQRHRRGAVADRAAHALDRAGAHVAHGERAAHAGLERVGHAARQHAAVLAGDGVGAGQHEAVLVDRHAAAFEPARLGIGADEQEHVAQLALVHLAVVCRPGATSRR
jgi:hypothetical protein